MLIIQSEMIEIHQLVKIVESIACNDELHMTEYIVLEKFNENGGLMKILHIHQ